MKLLDCATNGVVVLGRDGPPIDQRAIVLDARDDGRIGTSDRPGYVSEDLISLAILAVLTSVISVFFYLRIVVQMYMVDDKAPAHRPVVSKVALAGILLALVAVFYLGIIPGELMAVAADSVSSIF